MPLVCARRAFVFVYSAGADSSYVPVPFRVAGSLSPCLLIDPGFDLRFRFGCTVVRGAGVSRCRRTLIMVRIALVMIIVLSFYLFYLFISNEVSE